jgi:hypothetical protein
MSKLCEHASMKTFFGSVLQVRLKYNSAAAEKAKPVSEARISSNERSTHSSATSKMQLGKQYPVPLQPHPWKPTSSSQRGCTPSRKSKGNQRQLRRAEETSLPIAEPVLKHFKAMWGRLKQQVPLLFSPQPLGVIEKLTELINTFGPHLVAPGAASHHIVAQLCITAVPGFMGVSLAAQQLLRRSPVAAHARSKAALDRWKRLLKASLREIHYDKGSDGKATCMHNQVSMLDPDECTCVRDSAGPDQELSTFEHGSEKSVTHSLQRNRPQHAFGIAQLMKAAGRDPVLAAQKPLQKAWATVRLTKTWLPYIGVKEVTTLCMEEMVLKLKSFIQIQWRMMVNVQLPRKVIDPHTKLSHAVRKALPASCSKKIGCQV